MPCCVVWGVVELCGIIHRSGAAQSWLFWSIEYLISLNYIFWGMKCFNLFSMCIFVQIDSIINRYFVNLWFCVFFLHFSCFILREYLSFFLVNVTLFSKGISDVFLVKLTLYFKGISEVFFLVNLCLLMF